MAELVIRAGGDDIALMERVLAGRPGHRPHRVVTDAHAGPKMGRVEAAARRAGIPFLIDPQTHFLQDYQHPGDPWSRLGFGDPTARTPGDLLQPGQLDVLATAVVDHQLACGATAIIAPYVHVGAVEDGWVDVQAQMWRATRRCLDERSIGLDVLAVVALDWRLLDRGTWPAVLRPLMAAMDEDLDPAEVAVAASKVDQGVQPGQRLASFVATVREIRRQGWPVLAWQQGLLGEAAVAAGAGGDECGIGRREHCDLKVHMRSRREPGNPSAPRGARPTYIPALRRSVPRRSLEELVRAHPRIAAQLTCLEPVCCPAGQAALLADARAHTIAARRRSLDLVTEAVHPAWKWNHLASKAAAGLAVAAQVNTAVQRGTPAKRINTGALTATFEHADSRRQLLARRRAA